MSQSALWKVRVWSTWLSLPLMVITKSSCCQCLDLGCLHDTLWCGLVEKKVLVMQRSWKEQSSRSRWPFSFSLPTPKVAEAAWPGGVVCAYPGVEVSEQEQVFLWQYLSYSGLQVIVESILGVG